MMSHKDYKAAAKVIADAKLDPWDHSLAVSLFISFFAADNPRFSREKFTAACGEPVYPAPLSLEEYRAELADR